MGSIRSSNIKHISIDLVEKNENVFGVDFYKNREILGENLKDVSKKTTNLISGYVTRYVLKKLSRVKKEMEDVVPEE